MSIPRLLAILACLGTLAVTLPAALASLAAPDPADLGDAPARLEAKAPVPAPYVEAERRDLTRYAAASDYAPDPDQGTFHRTGDGVGWWGAAPGPATGDRPVVLLVHGAGRDGRSMIDMWHETAEARGLVLVAPDFGAAPGWAEGAPDPRIALAALEHAATLHGIDRDRVHLFGHSRGAIVAQAWANRYAGPWRSVAVHAGTLPAPLAGPVGEGVPMRHYLGTLDHIFPVPPARSSGRALAAAGHPFELVMLVGHTHWFYADGEAIAADAWAWMAGIDG